MSGFHEVRFPADIAYGATGGPEYSTSLFASAAGYERRNVNWAVARGRWDVGSGVKTRAQFEALIAFFRARKGRACGFRFKDWTDFTVRAQQIGVGDGTRKDFQLVKNYVSGDVVETRSIVKPVAGTVVIHLDDEAAPAGWAVDVITGVVTFTTAPAVGVVVAADCEFDVPVRFDTDRMELSLDLYEHGQWGSIPIVEIRV